MNIANNRRQNIYFLKHFFIHFYRQKMCPTFNPFQHFISIEVLELICSWPKTVIMFFSKKLGGDISRYMSIILNRFNNLRSLI